MASHCSDNSGGKGGNPECPLVAFLWQLAGRAPIHGGSIQRERQRICYFDSTRRKRLDRSAKVSVICRADSTGGQQRAISSFCGIRPYDYLPQKVSLNSPATPRPNQPPGRTHLRSAASVWKPSGPTKTKPRLSPRSFVI